MSVQDGVQMTVRPHRDCVRADDAGSGPSDRMGEQFDERGGVALAGQVERGGVDTQYCCDASGKTGGSIGVHDPEPMHGERRWRSLTSRVRR